MNKKIVLLLIATLIINVVFGAKVVNASGLNDTNQESFVLDGDLSLEEGAQEVIVRRNTKLLGQIRYGTNSNEDLGWEVGDKTYKRELSLVYAKQENNYYCGPATVQQTIRYLTGSASSQSYYASLLGTTSSGTNMVNIPSVLNSELKKKNYSGHSFAMYDVGTFGEYIVQIKSALNYNRPVIIDIDATGLTWKYRTSGHFLNIVGLDTTVSPARIKIADPFSTDNVRWVSAIDVYKVNKNHFRHAMIY